MPYASRDPSTSPVNLKGSTTLQCRYALGLSTLVMRVRLLTVVRKSGGCRRVERSRHGWAMKMNVPQVSPRSRTAIKDRHPPLQIPPPPPLNNKNEKRRCRGREREMGTAGVFASKDWPSRYIAGIACKQRLSSEHACAWDLEDLDPTSWCWMGVAHTTSSSQT